MEKLGSNMQAAKDYFTIKGKNAENVLHDLSLKTFLTDWCYLNPLLPDGKELCDLLVIFDNIAIIWQIKDLKLDKQGKYKKSEVEKNLRQLSGACRQLFDLKTKIELENPRRGKELFDPTTISEIYLISALLGEGEEFFSGIKNIKGHTVHVFTKNFTEIILNELDTISDFCKYLGEKEVFISKKNKKLTIIGGEEELLASYLMNNRSFERLEKFDNILIEEGSWEQFQNKPEYKARKEQDKISYGWDGIIGRIHEGSTEYEIVARELARPNRFERRYLSKAFLDAHGKAHKDNRNNIFRRMFPVNHLGVTYCFLFVDESAPRNNRVTMLINTCYVARGKNTENKKAVGIATEKRISPECSYDFCLIDKPDWTEEDQKQMEKLQKETGIFVNPVISPFHEDEYPK